MRTEACREWRGELALLACGRPDLAAEAGLHEHLDRCPVCRTELAALRRVAVALDHADPDDVEEAVEAPPGLPDRILRRVEAERTLVRRRARRRTAALLAAAAVLVVALAGLVGALRDGGSEPTLAVVFHDTAPGMEGTAELVSKPWGTEVSLAVDGLDPDDVYWLWLTDADGERMGAGTFSGGDGSARVVLASALPTDAAARIWVTDTADRVVLDEHLDPD